jgi:hypothetical protein
MMKRMPKKTALALSATGVLALGIMVPANHLDRLKTRLSDAVSAGQISQTEAETIASAAEEGVRYATEGLPGAPA